MSDALTILCILVALLIGVTLGVCRHGKKVIEEDDVSLEGTDYDSPYRYTIHLLRPSNSRSLWAIIRCTEPSITLIQARNMTAQRGTLFTDMTAREVDMFMRDVECHCPGVSLQVSCSKFSRTFNRQDWLAGKAHVKT